MDACMAYVVGDVEWERGTREGSAWRGRGRQLRGRREYRGRMTKCDQQEQERRRER